ncbi:MAG: hypothetical protein AB7N76_25640 [Planctomycetota bacterium]
MNEPVGGQKQPEFKLHRSAPAAQAEGGSSPILVVVMLVLLGVGGFAGYKVMNRKDAAPSPSPSAAAPSPSIAPEDVVEVPDEVWARIEFLVNEGNLDRAIDETQQKLDLYPNPALQAKLAALKAQRDGAPARPVKDLLKDALAAGKERNWPQVNTLATQVLTQDDKNATAYLLRAQARGEMGDKLAAQGDLEAAKTCGADLGQVEALQQRYR